MKIVMIIIAFTGLIPSLVLAQTGYSQETQGYQGQGSQQGQSYQSQGNQQGRGYQRGQGSQSDNYGGNIDVSLDETARQCPFIDAKEMKFDYVYKNNLDLVANALIGLNDRDNSASAACKVMGSKIAALSVSIFGGLVPVSYDQRINVPTDPITYQDIETNPSKPEDCDKITSRKFNTCYQKGCSDGSNKDQQACLAAISIFEDLASTISNTQCKYDTTTILEQLSQVVLSTGVLLNNSLIATGGVVSEMLVTLISKTNASKARRIIKANKNDKKDDLELKLKGLLNCYNWALYRDLYCSNEFPFTKNLDPQNMTRQINLKKISFNKHLVNSRRYLVDEIKSTQSVIEQEVSNPELTKTSASYGPLLQDCYNGYVFINYKRDGSQMYVSDEKNVFEKYCKPLYSCVKKITGTELNDFPDFKPSDNNSQDCLNMKRAWQSLETNRKMIQQRLMEASFNGLNENSCFDKSRNVDIKNNNKEQKVIPADNIKLNKNSV